MRWEKNTICNHNWPCNEEKHLLKTHITCGQSKIDQIDIVRRVSVTNKRSMDIWCRTQKLNLTTYESPYIKSIETFHCKTWIQVFKIVLIWYLHPNLLFLNTFTCYRLPQTHSLSDAQEALFAQAVPHWKCLWVHILNYILDTLSHTFWLQLRVRDRGFCH